MIRDELGPVDVMALSTGGLIGQHLALQHPELVRRLVLVVSGARLADAGRQMCRTWLAYSWAEDWRSLRGAMAAAATFSGRAKGARLALIDGVPGMMWAPGGQVRVVFDFIISGGKIAAIEMIADPEHLAQLEVVPA